MEPVTLPPIPSDEKLLIATPRMVLEPVVERHMDILWDLFVDSRLHTYTPFEVPILESQKDKCKRWVHRTSPDGNEIWLNWVAFCQKTQKAIGHFQVGIKPGNQAYTGYVIQHDRQGQGFAREGMTAVIELLRASFGVRHLQAFIDSRNERSIRLAERLGMSRSEFVKDAAFFKGSSSDEWVYEISLRD